MSKKIYISEQQFNILSNGQIMYHGEDVDPDSYNRDTLWLTDDYEYASRAGDKVYKYFVSNNFFRSIASEEILQHYYEMGAFGEPEGMELQEILWDPISCDSFLDWIVQEEYNGYETHGIDGEYFLCVFPSVMIEPNDIKRLT